MSSCRTPGAPAEAPGFGLSGEAAILRKTAATESRLHGAMRSLEEVVERTGTAIEALAGRIDRRIASHARLLPVDRFAGVPAVDLVRDLAMHPDDGEFVRDLEAAFLSAFVRHHPPYRQADCTVVSGSARTALGLLGFHCGIREVVIPDLSWTYEHCFPSVQAVPLTAELGLDADAIIATVAGRISADPEWPRYGAVVLNNPHNATGKVFAGDEIRRLVEWLVLHHVRVIDDLSYENVAPVPDLPAYPHTQGSRRRPGGARQDPVRPGRPGDHGTIRLEDGLSCGSAAVRRGDPRGSSAPSDSGRSRRP